MTVKSFLETLEGKDSRYSEVMKRITHIWSNDASVGYAIVAMRATGMSREHILAVVAAMQSSFSMPIDEAAEMCIHF